MVVLKGTTFRRPFTLKDAGGVPVNLTGYTARLRVYGGRGSPSVLLTLTTDAGGGITLGGAAGTVTVVISAAATAALDFTSGFYTLELDQAGEVDRWLEGEFTVQP